MTRAARELREKQEDAARAAGWYPQSREGGADWQNSKVPLKTYATAADVIEGENIVIDGLDPVGQLAEATRRNLEDGPFDGRKPRHFDSKPDQKEKTKPKPIMNAAVKARKARVRGSAGRSAHA